MVLQPPVSIGAFKLHKRPPRQRLPLSPCHCLTKLPNKPLGRAQMWHTKPFRESSPLGVLQEMQLIEQIGAIDQSESVSDYLPCLTILLKNQHRRGMVRGDRSTKVYDIHRRPPWKARRCVTKGSRRFLSHGMGGIECQRILYGADEDKFVMEGVFERG